MRARKRYTAQELRSASLWFFYPPDSTEKAKRFDGTEIAQMLLQAAEMRERREEVIADVNGPDSRSDHGAAAPDFDANEIVDYILRGDAWKRKRSK